MVTTEQINYHELDRNCQLLFETPSLKTSAAGTDN